MAEIKEKIGVEQGRQERAPMIDTQERAAPLPKEVLSWMEQMERATPATVKDDSSGQPIMTPSAPSDPVIQLPITRQTFVSGFKKTMTEAGRWLSEFVFRLIKIKKGKTKFKDE